MAIEIDRAVRELPVLDDCWNRIGVRGDRSCPELTALIHCHNCPVFARAGQRLFERPPPPECVDEWTDHLARPSADEAGNAAALVVFRVGGEWLGLDVQTMIEVAEPRVVHRIPHRRDRLLRGLVNIRGELQLCLSMQELLGIPTDAPTAARTGWLLVAESAGRRWALAVDEVAGVQRVPQSAVGNAPATVKGSLTAVTRGVFVDGDRRIGCLDAARLFETIARCLG